MATPFVPIAHSCPGSTKTRTQRSSSLGSISSSNSSKGPLEDCNMDSHKKRNVPDQMSCGSSLCNSPLIRTKYPGGESSIEYHRRSSENLQEVPESGFDGRPSTPTILGYEVMEERAKFTVYKILVRTSPEESWVVFRRYTDFSRLNDKLKEMFPGFRLALPPKRWFKDNYEHDFLEDRQLGLQAFLQNLVAHKDITNCLAVREFLCLDDPPGPFDSLVESRAFCETLEETNFRLHKDVIEKQKELETLKKMLSEKQLHIDMLERQIRTLTGGQGLARKLSGHESDCSGEVESSVIEADQEGHSVENGTDQANHTDFWSVPTVGNTAPEIDIAEVAEHVEI